jgi:tRNA delta(2)-isopentenylpyrophosphate transferase
MFDQGLEAEVSRLREEGYVAADPGMQAIGYREFFMEDVAARGRDAICAQIQNDSRKYAKRQETFIRPMQCVTHVHADDRETVRDAVLGFLAGSGLGT